MLVLARRVGEEIVIGDDIRVTVLEVRGGQVRLGIVAPKTVRVLRQEIENLPADLMEPPLMLARSSQLSPKDTKIMAGMVRIAR